MKVAGILLCPTRSPLAAPLGLWRAASLHGLCLDVYDLMSSGCAAFSGCSSLYCVLRAVTCLLGSSCCLSTASASLPCRPAPAQVICSCVRGITVQMSTAKLGINSTGFILFILFFRRLYVFGRESACTHTQAGGAAEGQGEASSPLHGGPTCAGLRARTPGSWPEPKADTEPPGAPGVTVLCPGLSKMTNVSV